MIVLLALQLSVTQPAYWRCLDENITKLEVSGERPKDVGTAAVTLCRPIEPQTGVVMNKMREMLAEKGAARVVEIRACRKQGCKLPPF